jgi:hypothetical protein
MEGMDQKTCDIKTAACQRMMCHKFEALEKVMNTRFIAIDDALVLRTEELNGRLKGLNELRNEVVKDRIMFVTKESYDSAHHFLERAVTTVDDKTNLVINRLTVVETRAVTWTAAVALFFMIMQIVLHFWGPK